MTLRNAVRQAGQPERPHRFLPRHRQRELDVIPLPDRFSTERLAVDIVRHFGTQFQHAIPHREEQRRAQVLRPLPEESDLARISRNQHGELFRPVQPEIRPGGKLRADYRGGTHRQRQRTGEAADPDIDCDSGIFRRHVFGGGELNRDPALFTGRKPDGFRRVNIPRRKPESEPHFGGNVQRIFQLQSKRVAAAPQCGGAERQHRFAERLPAAAGQLHAGGFPADRDQSLAAGHRQRAAVVEEIEPLAFSGSGGECDRCKGHDKGELYANWYNRLAAHLKEKNITPMLWGDRLLNSRECGHGPWDASSNGTDTAIRTLDRVQRRVFLTQRELLGTWAENAARFCAGQTVIGVVRSLTDYGAFIELTPNLSGLAEDDGTLRVGDHVAVYIRAIVPETLKIKLSVLHRVEPQPREPLHYFQTGGHITQWRYGNEHFAKCYTIF